MYRQEPDGKACLLILASTYPRWQNDPEPGFVHELSKRLTDRFRVIVLCPHAPGAQPHEVLDGVEIMRYHYAPERWETLVNDGGIVTNLKLHRWKLLLVPGFILMQAWWAWRLCRREKVDVIHAHWLIPQGLIAALLQSLPGRKVAYVVTSHGADLYALKGPWLDRIKAFVARKASAVTVVSSAMRKRIACLNVPRDKISVLPMGVDLSGLFFPDSAVPRREYEILFVGRLVEKKGLRYLLDALPAILRAVPDAHLTVIGFGPEEKTLKEQVSHLGIASAVSFIGAMPQAELPPLYRRAALFVAPFVRTDSGDQEGLPVALMEAVACGCPIIAGDVAGLEDLLGGAADAVCLDVHDVPALANKIIESLCFPTMAQTYADNIRATATQHMGWARISQEYAHIISECLTPMEK
ncbi:glycosyltransferase family 4 protein [Pseudothauera nasutitermitis]|uniref:Glycosyltransferase family 4 protein n=1 Tax=Pseudothauera nasutitermitis TaxID=2565930 RepID=A0A4S4AVX3_9RHOO|nr:glycosyltransferase [Pseudothauera nasutitermitis]THF64004.1 glycosyltransferase family 4 protein [Pseudothauera nasutitermitis]